MKKFILTLIALLLATPLIIAQDYKGEPFCFLGIPVDGKRSEMIEKLKDKGFTYDEKTMTLRGKFNGHDSWVVVSDNEEGKVDRIYISQINTMSQGDARIQYNNLVHLYLENGKYYGSEETIIPETEDIRYGISFKNKIYSSVFFFDPFYNSPETKETLLKECYGRVESMVYKGLVLDYSEDNIWKLITSEYVNEEHKAAWGVVWFRIFEDSFGQYRLGIYYDNMNNRPNGKEL